MPEVSIDEINAVGFLCKSSECRFYPAHRKLLVPLVGNIRHLGPIRTMERPMILTFIVVEPVQDTLHWNHLSGDNVPLDEFRIIYVSVFDHAHRTGRQYRLFRGTIVRLYSGKYPLYSNPRICRDRATLQ